MCIRDRYNVWNSVIDVVKAFVRNRIQQMSDMTEDIFSIIYHSEISRVISDQCQIQDVENILNVSQPRFGDNDFHLAIDDIGKLINKSNLNHLNKFVIFLSDGGDCYRDRMLQSIDIINNASYQNLEQWQNIGFGPAADHSELSNMTNRLKQKYNCSYSRAINNVELDQTFAKFQGYLQ
eukprot:TRINITY_DN13583_c0_g1_i1.p1 TRINITY_DN13583_c0_g1~~TRINITY_DN13583_c0_g1_i1.p1  ORF type:complete len:179 (+),score=31.91 TRINITY_DN13583_c0_g1_i1:158-694(+)